MFDSYFFPSLCVKFLTVAMVSAADFVVAFSRSAYFCIVLEPAAERTTRRRGSTKKIVNGKNERNFVDCCVSHLNSRLDF